jgi:hypothetical protein
VTLASGNIDLQTGSIIRSNGTVGGFIQLTTASTGIANVDGLVESVGSQSGQSPNQGPGGGPITIKAGCELEIGDDGVCRAEDSVPARIGCISRAAWSPIRAATRRTARTSWGRAAQSGTRRAVSSKRIALGRFT